MMLSLVEVAEVLLRLMLLVKSEDRYRFVLFENDELIDGCARLKLLADTLRHVQG